MSSERERRKGAALVMARRARGLMVRDAKLLKRLTWDTEAGAVGVYADSESDIRVVASLIEELLTGKA